MAETIEQTPAAPNKEGEGVKPAENISVPKSEWDDMKKMVSGLADKTQKQFGFLTRKLGVSKGRGTSSGEPDNAEEERELVMAVKGISLAIASNSDYQKLISQDKTLQQVLENNPLTLLKGNYTTADEIVDAFRDYMDERAIDLSSSPSASPSTSIPAPAPTPAAVAPAKVNPSNEEVPGKTEEERLNAERLAKMTPDQRIEAKIAGRVNFK